MALYFETHVLVPKIEYTHHVMSSDVIAREVAGHPVFK